MVTDEAVEQLLLQEEEGPRPRASHTEGKADIAMRQVLEASVPQQVWPPETVPSQEKQGSEIDFPLRNCCSLGLANAAAPAKRKFFL